ncbi:MAG TPA: hypothetical protein PLK13_20195 [Xanthobacteraceae bacterium]|jgi:hypothetical protein|uniref:hypothetical protein n=1 Tax=Roseixanthobacter finlandensis TaxID=3119922 RepID=UPI002CDBBD54|nr:hypothetical protein [Xanthobacteraceae bacterium]HQS47341.1 hypothetical protein [Xanthobacteraceae bacterium]
MNSYWILIIVGIINFEVGTPATFPGWSYTSQKECNSAKKKIENDYIKKIKSSAGKTADVQTNAWCVPIKFRDDTMEGEGECDGCR